MALTAHLQAAGWDGCADITWEDDVFAVRAAPTGDRDNLSQCLAEHGWDGRPTLGWRDEVFAVRATDIR